MTLYLPSLASLSSEPYGHLAEEEGEEGGGLEDGLVQVKARGWTGAGGWGRIEVTKWSTIGVAKWSTNGG